MKAPPDELRAVFREASLGEQVLVMWWTQPHSALENQAPHDWLWALRNGTDRLVALARIDTGLERVAAGPVGAPAAEVTSNAAASGDGEESTWPGET